MKRFFLTLAVAGLSLGTHATTHVAHTNNQHTFYSASDSTDSTTIANPADSVAMTERIGSVEVVALRADKTSPVAYTDISHNEIERNSYGTDIPSLLALTPSLIATNETGIGIGGTSIRLRGTDATRLNVTVNGMPLNNPDSHSTYWYDTPDLISAVGDVQVQRGAGISTNGTGAFGGAISMTTSSPATTFGGSASLSYGSYNTNKQAIHIGSGLMGGHWAVDARLTHIGSDGYIERGATDLKSYMLQGGYYGSRTSVKLLSFGGVAKTYLTYTGVTKEEMRLYGRRYHTEGQYETSHGPYTLADGTHVDYYDDQTDNYLQINNQLIINHRFNEHWAMNATGFYTYGYGYYKQYKDARTLLEYGNLGITDPSVEADMIRRKIMRNHTFGANASAHYTTEKVSLAFGGSWSHYSCPHWGDIEWVDGMKSSEVRGKWYDNDVRKQDANIFAKAAWRPVKGLSLSADLQYRLVSYRAWGVNDNFDWNTMQMQPISIDKLYHFLNPHIGINYTFARRHSLFASFAIANKEPTRADFTDRYMFSQDKSEPKPERLFDYELGYRYSSPKLSLGVNLYYMQYRNQLIPTGMVNDSSDALNVNVPDSYRCGVEVVAEWHITKWLSAQGDVTFSRNKIRNYVDLLADSPTYGKNLGTMTIAYSPDCIASFGLDFHIAGFEALLRTRYVSKQYLTNNEVAALTLDRYCVTNLDLGYTLPLSKSRTENNSRSMRFGLCIYNLFNTLYCSNAYGYSYMWDGVRYDEAYYFPQAPLHVLANVTIKF
ncbi:MAG: TonB-dependent receptor [Alistipes sp.]|nr:TonB-dependent receptor [Alistipes sp.]